MEVRNVFQELDHLEKDPQSDIQMLQLTSDIRSIFLARLNAGKKLPAHYHKADTEVYQVLSGEGLFEIGELVAGEILWSASRNISSGDIFEVAAGKVHRLSGGSTDLHLVFFTPPSHLKEDRYFL